MTIPNPLIAAAGLAFLLPSAAFGGSLDLLFGALTALLGLLALWTRPSPWETLPAARRAALFFGALELSAVLSYAYSSAFNAPRTGPLDWLELARPLVAGALAVFAVRQFDVRARAAMEAGMTASVYVAWCYLPRAEYAAATALALCWLLFFSRTRGRLVHAAAAGAALWLSGDAPGRAAGALALSAALAAALTARLPRRKAARPALLGLGLFTALGAAALHALPGSLLAERPRAELKAWSLLAASPVLGWGPARYEELDGAGQYALWAARGGALGAGLLLAGAASLSYSLLASGGRRAAGAAALLGCAALLLLSHALLDSYRLFLALALLLRSAQPAEAHA